MDYDIFISYRREGGAQYARILKAELEKRGYRGRVFLDYDELRDGKFDSRIMAAIDSARVFIFILSPGSLDRCCNAGDWVRQEILYALEHEKHIIPVNFDGLFTGFPLAVPEEIRTALGQHQFSKIDSESLLDASMEKMIADRIAPLAAPQRSFTPQGVGAEIMIISDADCTVKAFGREIGIAKADTPTPIRLKKGNYLLEFISTENHTITENLKYTVADNDSVDFIEIKIKDRVIENRVINPCDKDGKWGYIDEAGNTVIPFIYNRIRFFREGLAAVANNSEKWGFINKIGEIVIPFQFEDVMSFQEGLAPVRNDSGKWGFINKIGEIVVPFQYNDVKFFQEGLAAVENDMGEWGFINKTGATVIPFIYSKVSSFIDGLAAVANYRIKWGFINKVGEIVVPFQYADAKSFREGLAAVKNDRGRWGFINKIGEIVIPFQYEDADSFSEGLVAVKNYAGCGFINKAGETIIPFIYNHVYSFSEGLAKVGNDMGKYGYITKKGQVVIPFKFKYGGSDYFSNGLVKVRTDSDEWIYIDKKGNFVSKVE